MSNNIIGQNEETVNLDTLLANLEAVKCFWLEVKNGETAVIFQDGSQETIYQQRLRHHGPRKHIIHHRVEATYSRVPLSKEIGKAILRRFHGLLDKLSYEVAERDSSGKITTATLFFNSGVMA